MADDQKYANLEEIPKGTLLNIMKRKEKELRTATARLEHLHARSEMLERASVILQADRKSFRSLAARMHADLTAFEAATAKDEPVDLDELLISIDFSDYKKILQQALREIFNSEFALPEDPRDEEEISDSIREALHARRDAERAEIATLHEQFDRKSAEISDLSKSLQLTQAHMRDLTYSLEISAQQGAQREAELQTAIKENDVVIANLKSEISALHAANEAKSEGFATMIFQQESEIAGLRSEIAELKSKQSSLDALAVIAERQAERDLEITKLKKEIERLSRDQPSKHTNYLKSVLLKWIHFVKDADPKRFALVPVLEELLHLSDVEKHIMHSV